MISCVPTAIASGHGVRATGLVRLWVRIVGLHPAEPGSSPGRVMLTSGFESRRRYFGDRLTVRPGPLDLLGSKGS